METKRVIIIQKKERDFRELVGIIKKLNNIRNLVLILQHRVIFELKNYLITDAAMWDLLLWGDRSNIRREKIKEAEAIAAHIKLFHNHFLQQLKKLSDQFERKTVMMQIIKLREAWQSYFALRREAEKKKSVPLPSPPSVKKWKSGNGPFFIVPLENISAEKEGLKIKLGGKEFLLDINWERLERNKGVRAEDIISFWLKYAHRRIHFFLVYKKELSKEQAGEYHAGIDLGIDNLITVATDNPRLRPIIIDGRELKSFNSWFYLKMRGLTREFQRSRLLLEIMEKEGVEVLDAELKEELINRLKMEIEALESKIKTVPLLERDRLSLVLQSRRKRLEFLKSIACPVKRKELEQKFDEVAQRYHSLWAYRNNLVRTYIHRITSFLARWLESKGIKTVFVGKGATEGKRLGRINGFTQRQVFHFIPYSEIIKKLEYKLEERGIELVRVDESYSSQCSCVSAYVVSKRYAHTAKRVARGLVKDMLIGKVFNADVNAAYNILRSGLVLTKDKFLSRIGEKKLIDYLSRPIRVKIFMYKKKWSKYGRVPNLKGIGIKKGWLTHYYS